MKRSILFCLSLFFIFLFFSCKKDSTNNNSSTYYIKATIGGTQKNYTSTPLATFINQSSVVLSAGTGTSSGEGLILQINQNLNAVTTGTYIESGTGNYTIGGVYNPGTTDVSAIFGAGFHPLSTNPLQIVIAQLTDKNVSGTFSGEFYDNSGTGSDSLLISNGSFNLPVH